MNSSAPAPGSPASLREMNRRRILDVLREQGALTQVEIATVTGLSPATVSNLVKELDAAGAVQLTASVRNGRRATLVTLAAASGLLGAIVFGDRHIRVAIGRGGDDVMSLRRLPLAAAYAADEQLIRAVRLFGELVDESGHELPEVRAVTVGLPAPVDPNTREVGSDGTRGGWAGLPVAATVEQAFQTEVALDNTANLGALAESRFGALRGVDDALFIRASHAVSAGLVINGRIYRGHTGSAGEIGHVVVAEGGRACACGNRGCLNTLVGSEEMLWSLRPVHGDHLTLADALHRAQEGDPACEEALGNAGRDLGVAAAGIVNLFNPAVVVLGGQLARVGEVVVGPMRETVRERAIPSAASVRVVVSDLDADRGEVLGALATADDLRSTADRAAWQSGNPRPSGAEAPL